MERSKHARTSLRLTAVLVLLLVSVTGGRSHAQWSRVLRLLGRTASETSAAGTKLGRTPSLRGFTKTVRPAVCLQPQGCLLALSGNVQEAVAIANPAFGAIVIEEAATAAAAGEPRLIRYERDADDIEWVFETPQGMVRIYAEIHYRRGGWVLDDFIVENGKVRLTRDDIAAIQLDLTQRAQEAGFETVQATSRQPGFLGFLGTIHMPGPHRSRFSFPYKAPNGTFTVRGTATTTGEGALSLENVRYRTERLNVGLRSMRLIFAEIAASAQRAGADYLTIVAERTTGAAPGRDLVIRYDLTGDIPKLDAHRSR